MLGWHTHILLRGDPSPWIQALPLRHNFCALNCEKSLPRPFAINRKVIDIHLSFILDVSQSLAERHQPSKFLPSCTPQPGLIETTSDRAALLTTDTGSDQSTVSLPARWHASFPMWCPHAEKCLQTLLSALFTNHSA